MKSDQVSVQTLFAKAVDHWPPERWPECLDAACNGDTSLYAEVMRLLDAHRLLDESTFMEHPAAAAVGEAIPSPSDELVGSTIGRYKILEQIGEGGMGVVYAAEQLAPVRRLVALKIVKPGADTRDVLARFAAERQVLAMMDHANIATILDGGITNSGRPYFVMEFVRGMPITEHCDYARLTTRQRLALFITVCHAVQHAHQKGIIHRDIKPSNVLVAVHDGLPVPKIIDFGVAKAIGQQLADHSIHTAVSQMVGTPLYMSPEQAGLNGCDIDVRSDIYSLGVLLYTLLAGRLPFEVNQDRRGAIGDLRRRIQEEEPPSPSRRLKSCDPRTLAMIAEQRSVDQRRLQRLLRGELDWIVLKALEKGRDRRYQSVADLSADIQRYLESLPIQARPASIPLRVRKWGRRHPIQAITVLATMILALAFLAGSYWHTRQLAGMLTTANQLREDVQNRETDLRHELYATNMHLAWQAATFGYTAEARRFLDRNFTEPGEALGFEWRYLNAFARAPLQSFHHQADLLTADVSPDGQFLASGDCEGLVSLWNLENGTAVKSWRYDTKEITSVRFSPDGRSLATAGQDQTIRLYSVGEWVEVAKFSEHTKTVCSVAWSPDSGLLASAGRDNRVHLWDVGAKKLSRSLPEHSDVVRVVAWSPDGRFLASAGGSTLQIWDKSDWSKHRELADTKGILAVAFSPNSQLLAYGGYGESICLVSTEKFETVDQVKTTAVWSLLFPSDEELLVGTGDGVAFFEIASGGPRLRNLRQGIGTTGRIRSLLGTDHGDLLITASQSARVVETWDLPGLLGRTIRIETGSLIAAVPDLDVFASVNSDRTVQLLDTRDGTSIVEFPSYSQHGSKPAISPKGDLLAIPKNDGTVWLYDTKDWQCRRQLKASRLPVLEMSFSYDGRWLAGGCLDGLAGAWDLTTGQWQELWDGKWANISAIGLVACSQTEPLMVVTSVGGTPLQIWRFQSTEPPRIFAETSPVFDLEISPNGKTLAVGEENHSISLWDLTTCQPLGKLLGHENIVTKLTYSPDGKTLASYDESGTIRLWNMKTQRELFPLMNFYEPIHWMKFLSSNRLAICSHPGNRVLIFGRE